MAERRETSVVVVEFETGEFYIISTLSTGRDTQVIAVDPTTGALGFSGRRGIDVFQAEVDALQYLTCNSRWLPKSTLHGKAILGYAALGSLGLLLIATKLRMSIADLPGGDSVYTVAESKWVKIPLRNPQPSLKAEAKNATDLTDIVIDKVHFFCETRDITRPFPSPNAAQFPDEEFAWNSWLSLPFSSIGLRQHCVVLLQGLADSRTFTDTEGRQVTAALTARRSRLHPGTRYLARGLNAAFSTGNEAECEQLVWPHVAPGQPVPFAMYLWRRGTVPLWWGAEIKSNIAEAEIYVCENRTYEGSAQYYKRLSRRYGSKESKDTKSGEKSKKPPIVCINLLRNGLGKPEVVLWQHFQDSLKYVRSQGEVNDARIFLLNYDWHDKTKAIGEAKTVEGLWQLLKDPTSDIKFDTGEYYVKGQQPKNMQGVLTPNKGLSGGVFRVTKKQEGVIRFNCADSLDRTNAASFFGAVQVLAEQCRHLGYPLDTGKVASVGFVNGNTEGSEGPLPAGWERRVDAVTGRVFYIDHNTRKTTWEHPCPQNSSLDKPWTRFDMSVDEFKEATIPGAIAGMAELFLIAGDIHATLYTGSKAMHSHIIQIFSDEGGKAKTLSPAQNLAITLQRRFLNVVMDSTRQKQLEMFVGLRLNKHFQSLPDQPLQVLSRPHACLLKPVPSMFPNAMPANSIISAKYKDTVWVCPSAAEVVELYIFLSEPCHVAQLLITVAHGADDLTSPALFDVRAGRHVDSLKLVLEGATIPRCSNGTQLLYVVPGARNAEDVAITGAGAGGNDFSWLYNFEEQEGELDFLTRIVVLTVYPASPGIPITLGEVEVLGVSLFSGKIYCTMDQGLLGSGNGSSTSYRDSLTPGKTRRDSESLHRLTPPKSPSLTQIASRSSPNLATTGFDLLSDTFHPPPQGHSSSGVGSPLVSDLFSWDPFEATSAPSNSPSSSLHTLSGRAKTTHQQSTDDFLLRSGSEAKGPAERYVGLLETMLASTSGRPFNFQEATELEISRLSVGLSAAERDRALLSIGRDPATLDPNRLLNPLHLVQVRQAAFQLALATQIAAEDKESAAIGFELQEPLFSEGDENEVFLECCSHPECEVVMRKKMSGLGRASVLVICDNCKRKTCVACKAGDECSMLVSVGASVGGPSGASSSAGPGRGPPPLPMTLCRQCCPQTIQDAALLDRIRVLAAARRKLRVQTALREAVAEAVKLGFLTERYRIPGSVDGGTGGEGIQSLYRGLASLAESPYASLLSSVPSAEGAEPAESLISHPGTGSPTMYWTLPPGVASVDIAIVLSAPSIVSGIVMVVSSCGFTPQGAPLIDLWCSNTVAETDRVSSGRWDISAAGSSAAESIYGPEQPRPVSAAPRNILFKLKAPTRCRMIWLRISLPSALGISYDLLGSPPRGSVTPACIHAKRFLVLGRAATDDAESMASQGPEKLNFKSALDAPARTVRLKVQIEGERSAAGGRMIQLFVPLMAPSISGFRLDALAAVRTAARYMVSGSKKLRALDMAFGSCVDEAVTNPITLQISVAAVQGENQAPVPVGTYLLPMTRPGTPLYYDFGQAISARVLVFELLGDVSAFVEEPMEQGDGSDGREAVLPASLSLANKIRPYTLVNAAELGKWPQLNAI